MARKHRLSKYWISKSVHVLQCLGYDNKEKENHLLVPEVKFNSELNLISLAEMLTWGTSQELRLGCQVPPQSSPRTSDCQQIPQAWWALIFSLPLTTRWQLRGAQDTTSWLPQALLSLFQEQFPNFKASLSGDHRRVRDSDHVVSDGQ